MSSNIGTRNVVIVGGDRGVGLRIAAALAAAGIATTSIMRADPEPGCGPGSSFDPDKLPRAPRTLSKHQAMARRSRGFISMRGLVWIAAALACAGLWWGAVSLFNDWLDSREAIAREAGRKAGHEAGVEAGRTEIRNEWRLATEASDREQRRLEQQRQRRQQEADHVQAQALARARADLDAARRAGDGLQRDLDRFVAAGRASCPNQPAAGQRPGDPGSDPLDLLANLFSRADREAGELAGYADQLRAAGQACEQRYDALRVD
jgi:hypothetical protein